MFLHKDGINAPSMTPYDEVQTITMGGTVTGGTFTLTFSGQTTAAIAYNATAALIKTRLEDLSNISTAEVFTSGGPLPGTPVVVTFGGKTLASKDVANMTTTSSLTGTGPTVGVTVTQVGGADRPPTAS